jgi:hypothetical protein
MSENLLIRRFTLVRRVRNILKEEPNSRHPGRRMDCDLFIYSQSITIDVAFASNKFESTHARDMQKLRVRSVEKSTDLICSISELNGIGWMVLRRCR